MNESEWVEFMAQKLRRSGSICRGGLTVETGRRIPYGYEVRDYGEESDTASSVSFETDLAVLEQGADGHWKPRVIVEAKIRRIGTHDAITYSHKAASHKGVHPYLRYGIMLGDRGHYPLPGRLFRHGAHFDFMISFQKAAPTAREFQAFERVLRAEVRASRALERILYESRQPGRERYTVLHRKLELR